MRMALITALHLGLTAMARGLFSRLQMPWYVLPGNHDAAAVRSGAFDEAFGLHAAREYIRWGSAGLLFVRDITPDASPASKAFLIGDRQSSALIEAAVADDPTLIFVFAHAPLVSAKSRADTHDGRYAGHFTEILHQIGAIFIPALFHGGPARWRVIHYAALFMGAHELPRWSLRSAAGR